MNRYLPFQPQWEDAMLDGRKICTSRTRRFADAGDTFLAFGHKFEILEVEKLLLDSVATFLFAEEGCESPQHFLDAWKQLHPIKGWVPEQYVWAHRFRLVE